MVQAVRMPMMGNTMETGLLAEWAVDEGDEVEEDDIIAIVESEKATADIVASQDGTLARIDVKEGAEVPPGTLIGVILGPEESLDDVPAPQNRIGPGRAGDESGQEQEPSADTTSGEQPMESEAEETGPEEVRRAPSARKLAEEHGVELADVEATGPEGAVLRADVEDHLGRSESTLNEQPDRSELTEERVFASPSSRRLARELGISIDEIEGTGTGARITDSDIRNTAGELRSQQPTARAVSSDAASQAHRDLSDADALDVSVFEEQSLSGMRRTITERMSRSARQAPHVTLNREISVERAYQAANELTEGGETPVGFTDLLIAATVNALDSYPRFNAWFEGDQVRLISERNVALAVDTNAGLVTPVIREAGNRSLSDIARRRRELTEAVLDGEYTMDDLQGGTFTISNLGMFGVDSFDPIINPPQVAILGVGRVHKDDERTCTLSLSFDHRVVDGADAARFLDTLTASIEAPTLVVAERSAFRTAKADGTERPPRSTEPEAESVDDLVCRDISKQARDIAAVHDWPTPTFDLHLGDGHPSITVHTSEATSLANIKRLTYAACRESTFADTIVGLRDPKITVS